MAVLAQGDVHARAAGECVNDQAENACIVHGLSPPREHTGKQYRIALIHSGIPVEQLNEAGQLIDSAGCRDLQDASTATEAFIAEAQRRNERTCPSPPMVGPLASGSDPSSTLRASFGGRSRTKKKRPWQERFRSRPRGGRIEPVKRK
jgi:hypothetical protein